MVITLDAFTSQHVVQKLFQTLMRCYMTSLASALHERRVGLSITSQTQCAHRNLYPFYVISLKIAILSHISFDIPRAFPQKQFLSTSPVEHSSIINMDEKLFYMGF